VTSTQSAIRDAQYIKLSDGRRLGFAEYGYVRGKTILYFHGGISCRLDLAWAASHFASRGIKVIAPDRPGVGISDPKPDRTMIDWAADIEELMMQLELDDCALLGWSLGSAYVLPCALALGEMFTKVATVGSCAAFDSPEYIAELGLFMDRFLLSCPEKYRWVARAVLNLSTKAPPHMLKKLAESEVSKSQADHEILKLMSTRDVTDFLMGSLQQGPDGVIDDYWVVREPWGFPVEEIGIDMTLFQGEEDYLAPMSGALRLSKLIPGARLVTIPRAGHFLMHTHLDQVLDALVK